MSDAELLQLLRNNLNQLTSMSVCFKLFNIYFFIFAVNSQFWCSSWNVPVGCGGQKFSQYLIFASASLYFLLTSSFASCVCLWPGGHIIAKFLYYAHHWCVEWDQILASLPLPLSLTNSGNSCGLCAASSLPPLLLIVACLKRTDKTISVKHIFCSQQIALLLTVYSCEEVMVEIHCWKEGRQ